jgi:hypothetical protein
VATKKRRRSQLARATTQRQQSRRALLRVRRRRQRIAATIVGVVAVLVALVAWVLTHGEDSASALHTGVDYSFVIDQSQHQATSTGGIR